MTDRAEFDRVASALALAYRAQPDVAARQMKNSLAFIAATSPFSLVPLHRVILGLRGHDMLMPKRSGQELQRYIQDLKTAGFSHVVEGHLDFEMAWQDYLGILAVLGVDRPSHGTPSSQAVRSFFLRRDQIDRAAISPEALAATVDIHEEGAASQVTRNLRERDRVARERCIAIYRARHQGRIICLACKIDFGKRYGPLGEGYIHIHHLNPLAEAKGPRLVSPEIDLVPLCPNCHAMVHQTRPPLTIARLVELLEE